MDERIEEVTRRGRLGLSLVIAGLVLQLVGLLYWSPGTFIVSAAVGVPLVVVGAAMFGFGVTRPGRTRGGST